MQEVGENILEMVVAVAVAGIASIFAGLLGVFVGMMAGSLLFKVGLNTDEGAAWSGISLGIPCGTVFALLAFIYTFRRVRRYGQPE